MEERFNKIGVIGKYQEPCVKDEMLELCQYIAENGRDVFIDSTTAESVSDLGFPVLNRQALGNKVDLCVVVGGDGTLLNAARSMAGYNIPLLGYNLGRLGFLTDISPENMKQQVSEIFSGEYLEECRILLHAGIHRRGELFNQSCALNDVVVHKWIGARMLEYDTFIDGQFVNTSRSDGLIVSTPTGSTGYALSGGGPVLHPSLQAIVLVPICPHTMTYRPIVVHADSTVEIMVKDCSQSDAQVTCDGQINLGLRAEDRVIIRRHKASIRLIHPKSYDYYAILRAKLQWANRL